MTAIIKNKFRLRNARGFVENFDIPQSAEEIRTILEDSTLSDAARSVFVNILNKVPDRNHYLFVGKPFGWNTTSSTDTNSYEELNPESPKDHAEYAARIWDEMLGLKKIGRGDVSLVIPRSDWRPNTVYAPFDDKDLDLYNQPTVTRIGGQTAPRKAGNFYVLTKLMEVFICVDNNNGSVSTKEPKRPPTTGPNSSLNGRYEEDDGYVWQYVTSIGPGDAVKFLTDSWIPVRTLPENSNIGHPQEDVQSNAIPGELLRVAVESNTTTGNFDRVYTGKIERVPTNSKEITFFQSTTNPLPAAVPYVYQGYELHVTIPEVIGEHPEHVKRYKIVGYVTSPIPKITIEQDFTDLSLAVLYDCQILPLINVQTNGTSVSVKPVVNAAGRITSVEILDAGSKATTMKMEVNLPFVGSGGFEGTVPTIRPVVSPPQGLCKDPEADLGAFFAMVSTQLKYAEGDGDFPVANDYRQIGIVRDVKKLIKNNSNQDVEVLATENTLNGSVVVNVQFLTLSDLGTLEKGFTSDQEVEVRLPSDPTKTLGKARVVQFVRNPDVGDLRSGKLYLLQTKETGYFPLTEGQLFIASPGVDEVKGVSFNATNIPAVVREEFLKFHGDILYIENRRAVLRSEDQIEDIKTIIEF